jgi:CTP synthase (UTP-ammonia lyase)
MPAPARIAVVGDYNERNATHRATDAELTAGGAQFGWVSTAAVGDPARSLGEFDGIFVAPASPYASMEGALAAIRHAREQGVPLVGTCGGFQHVVVEIARTVLGIRDADHAETHPEAEHLAVTPLSCSLVGQRHPVEFIPGSRVAAIYGSDRAVEPYFCAFGLNPALEPQLEAVGLRITGRDELGSARVAELDGHPFFVATLYVFQARDDHADLHPLTAAFLEAARATGGAGPGARRGPGGPLPKARCGRSGSRAPERARADRRSGPSR